MAEYSQIIQRFVLTLKLRKIDFKKVLGNSEKPKKPTAKDMIIVSIGSGSVKQPYYYKDFKDAGVFQWIKPSN